MKLTWIKINTRKYGGSVYGDKVKEAAVRSNLDLREVKIAAPKACPRYLKPLGWLVQILKIKETSDIWIRDSFVTVAMSFFNRTVGKNVAIIHHIDGSVFPILFRPLFYMLEKLFYSEIKKTDIVVTVSEYWRKHFLNMGCKNVVKIYNGLNPDDFKFSEEEISFFKAEHGITGKPIVYIGNCQRSKGVVEVYKALKDLNVHLVTSGEQQVKIPAKNFNLEYKDYLRLLKSSVVAITMSKFKEGWCLTAHEAMLCKTPVIGSGLGGMKELLDGGRQAICSDFNDLKNKVEQLLDHNNVREKMGEDGFNYAKTFTTERLEGEWSRLINTLKDS